MAREQELIKELLSDIVEAKSDISKSDYKWLIEELTTSCKLKNDLNESDCNKEINGLAMCLLWGISDSIRDNYTRVLTNYEAKVILQRLVKTYGQQEEFARWCIEVWCQAHNKIVDFSFISNILRVNDDEQPLSDIDKDSQETPTLSKYSNSFKSNIKKEFPEQKGRFISREEIINKPTPRSFLILELSIISLVFIGIIILFSIKYLHLNQTNDSPSKIVNLSDQYRPHSGFNATDTNNNQISKYSYDNNNQNSASKTNVNWNIENEKRTDRWSMFGHDSKHTNRSPFIGPKEFKVKWKFPVNGVSSYSSPVIAPDGTIYFSLDDWNLYAVNQNGILKWKYFIKETANDTINATNVTAFQRNTWINSTNTTPAISSDGTVYIGCQNSRVLAISPQGKLKWSTNKEFRDYSSVTIGTNGTLYVCGYVEIAPLVFEYRLFAINPKGMIKWSKKVDKFPTTPAIASDGTIYVSNQIFSKLYAFSPKGAQKWLLDNKEFYSLTSPAIGSDGTIYVGSSDNNLYSVSPAGKIIWKYSTSGDISTTPTIAADGTIYIRSNDLYIHAINPKGQKKWLYPVGLNQFASLVVDRKGTIYLVGTNGKFEAINSEGKNLWIANETFGIKSTPSINSDGTIYAFLGDECLYAIGPGEGK